MIKLKDLKIDPALKETVPAKYVYHYRFMPLDLKENVLKIAISDPNDIQRLDDIRMMVGYQIEPLQAEESEIRDCLQQYYGIGADTLEKISSSEPLPSTPTGFHKEDLEEITEEASMIRFVNQIFLDAFKERATDIHIEPFEDKLRIRYRIDGILYDKPVPPEVLRFHSALISRIKIMANLNIAERRLPQDGRMQVKIGDNDLDLRVSILPTQYGETLDIRILSSKNVFLTLPHLGLMEKDVPIIDQMLKKTHGVILVTGPTGSGKSTTLYACLSQLNQADKKIITIEDPIEYQIDGVSQLQVHPKIGFTFAKGLRSMLRHDPNVMMVGEIRDYETAEITIRCALTGHIVFSTLHTNDAASSITRLIDMGIEPFLVCSAVECIIAQRLVRLLCPHCRKQVKPEPALIQELGVQQIAQETFVYEPQGCDECQGLGFRGRTAIYEILVISEPIREMIIKRESAHLIKQQALKEGMHTLRMDGLEKAKKGITTIGEILRVTQEEII